MSTTGSWNTQDVCPWDKPPMEISKIITFAKPFVAPPRLPLGFNYLDISKDANIRVVATASEITKESFKANISTWGDTTLYSAGASWLEVSPGHLEYQNGEFSTKEDHPADKPQSETSRRISFDRSFVTPPKVIVFLKEIDMDKTQNCRLRTWASSIDANGFTIHINTRDGSILYSATAGWIAYPEDRPYVFSCIVNTQDVRPAGKPQLKNSRRIDYGGLKFWKPPNIFMAIRELDFDHKTNLRIRVEAKDVTETGLTWHMDSWGDSTFYAASASILAVV
ncbi:hypothetical protein HOY80DRAFT_1111993 [Tuber brumale]|nr:hypothetical protein HOY80DRAFT_1111993 [Tuber brumale]